MTGKLPVTEEDWARTPRPKRLEPDATDLQNVARANVFLPCPFCGSHSIAAFGQFQPASGLFGYTVACRCNAMVIYNADSREEARDKAVEQWNTRPAVPATKDR